MNTTKLWPAATNPASPPAPGTSRLVFSHERYGELGDVYMPRDLRTGEPRGFAFVRFMDQRDADDAIDRMDGEFFAGRELRIQVGLAVGGTEGGRMENTVRVRLCV